MHGLQARLPWLLAALWWGSLTAMGVAVQVLFAHWPRTPAAGAAAALLAAQAWISVACGVLLLVISKKKHAQKQEPWAQDALVFVLGGLLLALLGQYGVLPRALAGQGAVWFYLGLALYALQWLCALCVVWRLTRTPLEQPSASFSQEEDGRA
ncbi:DUF4149 domain-containing protein [Comamonas sp. GB3 AK4-5]|uniref:DUF4149 domain-containing protein n=1 Tax=Comamonas sp. GB3 AK4-5 TaxID=3231487 RepID=UPI00351EF929